MNFLFDECEYDNNSVEIIKRALHTTPWRKKEATVFSA